MTGERPFRIQRVPGGTALGGVAYGTITAADRRASEYERESYLAHLPRGRRLLIVDRRSGEVVPRPDPVPSGREA